MSILKPKFIIPLVGLVIIATLTTVAIIVLPLAPAHPQSIDIGDYDYTIEYATYSINQLIRNNKLPSVSIALIADQETVWQQAFGVTDLESNTPVTSQTIYRIGSISKVFTAFQIMRLHEQGIIDIDVPITAYLPDFEIKSRFNDTAPITIRQILAHRSGLPRNDNLLDWYWDPDTDILKEKVASVKDSYMAYPPGQRYKYSNFGYNLLARIIEVVQNELFPDIMEDEIFDPLSMDRSSFLSARLSPGDTIATGYYKEKRKNIAYEQYDIISLASGNMYSTMSDLSTFTKMVFQGGTWNGQQIIQNTTLWQMFEDQYSTERDPQPNGLGFFTDKNHLGGELIVYHDGNVHGTCSSMYFLPERKLGLVMSSNSDAFNEPSKQVIFDILALMLETQFGIVPEADPDPQSVEVDVSVLEQYTGNYIVNEEVAQVYLRGSRLKIKLYGYAASLTPISQNTFRVSHWLIDVGKIELTFYPDENMMIFNIEDIQYINSPRYPTVDSIPDDWNDWQGSYEMYARIDSVYTEEWIPATVELAIEDDMLTISIFHLLPLNSNQLLIVGSVFDGEVMVRDPQTGDILWQHTRYTPVITW